VRRLYEAIKINRDQKMKSEKLKKKVEQILLQSYRRTRKERKEKGGKEIWMG
jgi:hypothetical protein